MVRTFLLLTAVVGFGCNEKPGAEARKMGGGSAAPTQEGSGSAIKLPTLSGKAPARTIQPLKKPQFDKLAALGFEAFKTDIRAKNDELLSLRHELKERPKIAVQVLIQPCSDKAPCNPIELDKWSKDKLRSLIVQPLRDSPDLTFEMGITDLEGGAKAIWDYELGKFDGKDATGDDRHQYLNAYVLNYNDGVNQIRVAALYADDSVRSKAALAQLVPRERLEAVARAVLDTYTQAWAN